jgi:hypothetical protein
VREPNIYKTGTHKVKNIYRRSFSQLGMQRMLSVLTCNTGRVTLTWLIFSGEQETQYWTEKNKFCSWAGNKVHQHSGSIVSVPISYDCMHVLNCC